jgi:CelD/BcsL family acetyltransferase involved in cellulose biosynthesis
MRVEELTSEREDAYDAFVRTQAEALLYHSLGYRDLLLRHLGCRPHYVLALEGAEIGGVMPLMWTEAGGSRVWNSLPYYGSNGGVVASSRKARAALLATYRALVTSDATLAGMVASNPFADGGDLAPVHNITDSRISQATPLPFTGDPAEEIAARIDGSARRNVRKAQREGVTVEVDPGEMRALARIHRDNIESIGGLAKETSFFEDVQAVFEAGRDYDLWVARRDGAVVAALLVLYWGETAEYFTPAVEHDARPFQPLAAILLEAMTHSARRGVRRWNWGGTWETQTGVYRFKRKWGAVDRAYTYYVQLNDLSVLNWPRERFGELFPHFFVVPFSELQLEGASA